jgi:Nitrile hydratase beta subunit
VPVRVTRVSRVHDIGGQTGFGPVPVAADGGPPFAADWEARVYALAAVVIVAALDRWPLPDVGTALV